MKSIKHALNRLSTGSKSSHKQSTTKTQKDPDPDPAFELPPPPPPAYSVYPTQPSQSTAFSPARTTTNTTDVDSPFAFLGQFDTIFLIDDSGSMTGRNWQETRQALSAISPIITEHDSDGIDIYFLNHRNHRNQSARASLGGYSHVTSAASVNEIFQTVQPSGGTPTGWRLDSILRRHLTDLSVTSSQKIQDGRVKPLNVIVITDGEATDDVESVIVSAAKELDKIGAEPWQIGIQFFQVGRELAASRDLEDLDDNLAKRHGIRDMVDTVPWNGDAGLVLTAEAIMKVTMGAINRRWDRKRVASGQLQ